MTTFYVAAPSGQPSWARRHMGDLERAGMVNALDWTALLGAPESEWRANTKRDLDAALSADVFVLLGEQLSPGAMLELGARIGAGRFAHVVAGDHFFFSHPLVTSHASWEFFLASLGGAQ